MLQAVAEQRITSDVVVGTSVGSLNGAVVALGPGGAAKWLPAACADDVCGVFPAAWSRRPAPCDPARLTGSRTLGLAEAITDFLPTATTFAELSLPVRSGHYRYHADNPVRGRPVSRTSCEAAGPLLSRLPAHPDHGQQARELLGGWAASDRVRYGFGRGTRRRSACLGGSGPRASSPSRRTSGRRRAARPAQHCGCSSGGSSGRMLTYRGCGTAAPARSRHHRSQLHCASTQWTPRRRRSGPSSAPVASRTPPAWSSAGPAVGLRPAPVPVPVPVR